MNAAEPSLWRQVDALRELLQEGGALLGEVLLFARDAEQSLAAFERERKAFGEERAALLAAKEAAEAELAALRQSCIPVERVEEAEDASQARVRSLQTELHLTRSILESERSRRNRAIALIRPTAGQETPA